MFTMKNFKLKGFFPALDLICRTVYITQDKEYRINNTEYGIQNTEYRIQNKE